MPIFDAVLTFDATGNDHPLRPRVPQRPVPALRVDACPAATSSARRWRGVCRGAFVTRSRKSPPVSKGASLRPMDNCNDSQEAMARSSPHTTPSREVLRSRTQCPGCGKVMTYHALAYKHRCPRIPFTWDGKKQKQIAALEARIRARVAAMPEPHAVAEQAVADAMPVPIPA